MKSVANFRTIAVTAQTVHSLVKAKETDALALYMAYFEIADWQGTYRVKATTGFMATRLGWTEPRVQKAKKVLKAFDLIEDFQNKEEGKITGHYVAVYHLVKDHPPEIAGGGNNLRVENMGTSTHNVSKSTHNVIKVPPDLEKSGICESKNNLSDTTVGGYHIVPTGESGEPLSPRKKSTTPDAKKVFDLFDQITKTYTPVWNKAPVQRAAAQNLFEKKGLDKIGKALMFYVENKHEQYIPHVYSPAKLDEHWTSLVNFKNKIGL